MIRFSGLILLVLALAPSATFAQDMATRRANRTIRAQEKEILDRVTQRVEWDKQLTGSTLQVEVQPGGMVLLKGSVMSAAAKARAVDLVENTTGVESVTDELAIVKAVKVYEAPSSTATTSAPVAAPTTVPTVSRIISKP